MATALTMPKIGHLMEEGIIVRWRKEVGDKIEKGDVVFDVEMDKAVTEVESFVSGRLLKILVPEGSTVPVGTPVAMVGSLEELGPCN